MLNVDDVVLLRAASFASPVFLAVMKCCPYAFLTLFVCFQRDFFRINISQTMWIDRQYHLVAVVLPMNEGNEQASRRRAQNILQYAGVQVIVQLFPHLELTIRKQ